MTPKISQIIMMQKLVKSEIEACLFCLGELRAAGSAYVCVRTMATDLKQDEMANINFNFNRRVCRV